jgi:hypothetical protein
LRWVKTAEGVCGPSFRQRHRRRTLPRGQGSFRKSFGCHQAGL